MRGKTNPFTSSEFVLLGLLYQNPTHGYDLHKMITDPEGIGMIWNVKMSNLYAQLDKLETKGYIKGILQPGDTHPNRTEYQITETGRSAFHEWMKSTVIHPRDFRQEFMARYYYMMQFSPELLKDFFNGQLEECKKWLKNTKDAILQDVSCTGFKKSVMEFRVSQIESIVFWLEKVQNDFKPQE